MKDKNDKKNTIIAVVIIALIIAIPIAIVKIMNAGKPRWQKDVDEKVHQLREMEKTSAINGVLEYTRSIYAMYLVEGAGEGSEDWPDNWTYYSYVASQTFYTCQQIPGTTPSNDIPDSEFVVCKHI